MREAALPAERERDQRSGPGNVSGPSVGYYCEYHRTSGMAGSLGS